MGGMSDVKTNGPAFAPVILAGGSGTRFWPRSRRSRAKQVLALEGEMTMIQQTLERLKPVAEPSAAWIVTNGWLREIIGNQLPEVAAAHIIAEPCARNTAPACGLAAFLLEKTAPDTVLGVFPSDHVVASAFADCQKLDLIVGLVERLQQVPLLTKPKNPLRMVQCR